MSSNQPNQSVPLTILNRVDIDPRTMCWNWRQATRGGYPTISMHGKAALAHRLSYEIFVGPIPEGLTIDHLCRNRVCCNPHHMEPVTRGVNTLRGDTITAHNAAKTHCRSGHILAGENLYVAPGGGRHCRTCARVTGRRSHQKRQLDPAYRARKIATARAWKARRRAKRARRVA